MDVHEVVELHQNSIITTAEARRLLGGLDVPSTAGKGDLRDVIARVAICAQDLVAANNRASPQDYDLTRDEATAAFRLKDALRWL